jgi:hypothetical protein
MSISGLWRLSLAVLLTGGPAALAQESEPIDRRVEQLYASASRARLRYGNSTGR